MAPVRSLPELRTALAAVAVCEGAGLVGVPATTRSVRDWLPTLDLPPYQPPGWVFGPVWTVLYALMGLSVATVRRTPPSVARTRAERLFAVQLVLNALWSWLFFGRRSPTAGLVDIVALLIALGLTVRATWRVSSGAALLLAPYLAWVAFATALNADLWRRNRGR